MSAGTAGSPQIPDHEVLRVIGRGSYGVIWLARTLTGRLRAVKVIDRASFESERSFQREFDGMSAFEPISRRHAGFVNILHVGRGDGFFYYIMELADDMERGQEIDIGSYRPRTLKSDLDARGRLPPAECIEMGLSLADALDELHRHGLIHRDIKPANLIFVRGALKLADIGLVTTGGQYSFVGTEGYVPPEGPGTAQADIFSLGKVLYEITMGKDRLDFPEMATHIDEIAEKDHVLGLNEILLKACAAKISRRYTTAAEMRDDLLRLRGGRKPARVPAPLLAVAGLAVVVAAGGWLLSQSKPASRQAATAPPPQTPPAKIATPSPTPPTGSLAIETQPPGGKLVLLQGSRSIREGTAPFTVADLPDGDYTITGELGLATAATRATLHDGKQTSVVLQFPTGDGIVKITSSPKGATIFEGDTELGLTPFTLENVKPGTHRYRLHLDGYKDTWVEGAIPPEQQKTFLATLEHNLGPQPGKPWTNSLGMTFVPVGAVRFCIWETRVKDYAAFCAATGRAVSAPEFPQGDDHPVVLVNWQDATAFCDWLTEKERAAGLIGERHRYRLPTDREWSEAAGLEGETGDTPEKRDGLIHKVYPWGRDWPPPKGAGNYADQSLKKNFIANYVDGFPQTSPAGSFKPNAKGIFDLGGNVWEWCLDSYKGGTDPHDWGVLRGGSYANYKRTELESSYRNVVPVSDRDVLYGFRCVLEDDGAQ